jgi:steroid delta-isomerase-like uncharacterized protein
MIQDFYKGLNSRNFDVARDYISPDAVIRQTGVEGESRDREKDKNFIQGYIRAFPDMYWTLTDVIAQGNLVSASWTATGTHQGPLQLPNGKTIEATNHKCIGRGITVSEFKNNKIVSQDVYWDMADLLRQLGVLELALNR